MGKIMFYGKQANLSDLKRQIQQTNFDQTIKKLEKKVHASYKCNEVPSLVIEQYLPLSLITQASEIDMSICD